MNLSYVEKGEGKPLLMLHGYLASKECFAAEIAYFSRFYHVYALDFPGMGGADALTSPYSVSDYAQWTKAAMRELGIDFPHLLAHSFGGRVAIKLLSEEPLFDRCVLVGCAGIVPKRGPIYRFRVGAYRAVRKFFPNFAERFGSRDYRALSPVMKESFKKIVNEDLREDAARITRPVLFLVGTEDGETPPASVEILHHAVKGSRYLRMEGCGHFAFLDDPLTFRLAAEEFYNEL